MVSSGSLLGPVATLPSSGPTSRPVATLPKRHACPSLRSTTSVTGCEFLHRGRSASSQLVMGVPGAVATPLTEHWQDGSARDAGTAADSSNGPESGTDGGPTVAAASEGGSAFYPDTPPGPVSVQLSALSASRPAAQPVEPDMLLLPVTVCNTIPLTPQATLADAATALLRRLPAVVREHADLPSGVLRLEVAVPRTATTALRWLAGQQRGTGSPGEGPPSPTAAAPAAASLGGGTLAAAPTAVGASVYSAGRTAAAAEPAANGPFLYFSGRRSSAPDTPGATAAEAATRGWSALAGAGAAWQWWGPGGGGFDSAVVSALQRFLSPSQPRVRILGGVRFDPRRTPDPEWAPFGSHCFVLPLLELTEAEDCCLLAVTLAWDAAAAAADDTGEESTCHSRGASELSTAAARAEAALRSMRPPAPTSAYGLRVTRSEPVHTPSQQEWEDHLAALLGGLQERVDTGAPAAAALASLLDLGVARQEYMTHGQQGLDDLLAAMTLSASASAAAGVRQPAEGDVGDGLDAIRDLIDGKVTISELAAAQGSGSANGTAPAAAAAADSLAATTTATVPPPADVAAAMEEELSKVVMARRTSVRIQGDLDPLHVLLSLQERDPRAYQLYFAPGPSPVAAPSDGAAVPASASTSPRGPAFLGCTPERLYARTGRFVASEAVAGTRPRGKGGDVEQDFWLSLDLLRSAKDHAEFCTVRDWIASQLAGPCEDVAVEIRKSVLKQGSVQHLFGRVAARLRRGRNDAHLLAALHPTPAVCGRPREAALGYLEDLESFDRGWYAGPFGWISGAGAEFVVAIRSGLVCPETQQDTDILQPPQLYPQPQPSPQPQLQPRAVAEPVAGARTPGLAAHSAYPYPSPSQLVHMFAGVGVVRGSDPAAEWQELDLKIRPLSSALLPSPTPSLAPNVNAAWAGLLVEELCRLGVNMFCVAPGSRSSPLTHAIACHPRARLNVCIDERSLGFWALGYSRATGRPAAVVTSSGTAVANLLPAVVEAGLSGVPLLLLTADRPAELRDTAANQTIDQAKIFGGFVRWFFDLPPPAAEIPGRTVLTAVSTAFRAAVASQPPGPVHLNLQFREPLAPVAAAWQTGPFLRGLAQWQASQLPFTSHISGAALPAAPGPANTLGSASSPAAGAAVAGGLGYGICGADVAALQALLRGSRRGLVVVGELTDPRDIVAAKHVAAALGWPVVADVLSGLRVGAPPSPISPPSTPSPSLGATAALYDRAVPVVHHMDHLLLGDRSWWRELRPDVILQLGPHLTSKRLGQFMDWAALGEEADDRSASSSAFASTPLAGVPWVYVAPHTLRHDPSHLVTHRVVLTLTEFRDAIVAPAAAEAAAAAAAAATAAGARTDPWVHVSGYGRLLLQLDQVVSYEIDAELAALPTVSEPFIARTLARTLPPGAGLFIGNSMPIRDMDMYACPPGQAAAAAAAGGGAPSASGGAASVGGTGSSAASSTAAGASGPGGAAGAGPRAAVGVPVAANRGASGIDGVLSTAAGFAEGLSRPATLLVGDLSFLHDINGLNLLRGGELRPPLTVVLVNNSGGGIFSFLPIAASVPEDEFTPLWATPQNVDLEAMCRAQGIPHQKVTSSEGLVPALQAAWGLNRHSVVEVITDRTTNVDLHRVIQAAALRAAKHAHAVARLAAASAALLASTPLPVTPRPLSQLPSSTPFSPSTPDAAPSFIATGVTWTRFRLPLTQPLTTTATRDSSSDPRVSPQYGWREGLLLRVQLTWPDGRPAGLGVGEVAPLPGLHRESLEEAEVQIAALSGLLDGVAVPPSLALLGGRLADWLRREVGFADPSWLAPSVRFGLECALLSALAAALHAPVSGLLRPSTTFQRPTNRQQPQPQAQAPATSDDNSDDGCVWVNGLLSPPVTRDEAADVAAATTAAVALVAAGYTAIKVKVARRSDPEADARLLAAVRAAVGPHVALRADANRGWSRLEAAVAFGRGAAAAGVGLQFVEEPTADPRDMAAFYDRTGIPVAVDESLDEGLIGPAAGTRQLPQPGHLAGGPGAATTLSGAGTGVDLSTGQSYSSYDIPANRAAGLAALVVKPAVVGGVEVAMEAVRWARRRGVQVVISSAFESSVGLAHLTQLAATADAYDDDAGAAAAGGAVVHHGLGTLQWFGADVAAEALRLAPQLLPRATQGEEQATRNASSGASAGRAVAGEFVPLQAVCATSQQADHVLRGCADGTGLRRSSLEHARQDTAAAAAAGADVDPWVSSFALGSILHRPVQVDVELPSLSASTQPIHGSDNGTQTHGSPGSSTIPTTTTGTRVTLCGLELLPPSACRPESASPEAVRAAACATTQREVAQSPRPFVFLHGFLGSSSDWLPLMRALAAAGHRCVALDLPGHGGSRPEGRSGNEGVPVTPAHTIPGAAACVAAAARQLGLQGAVLVGYSLGARVALQAAVNDDVRDPAAGSPDSSPQPLWSGAVLISGTPGIKDPAQAAARAANDDRLARSLVRHGLASFVRRWYEQPLWTTLRRHPAFGRMLARRTAAAAHEHNPTGGVHGSFEGRSGFLATANASSYGSSNGVSEADDVSNGTGRGSEVAQHMAAALSGMSTGRMAPLWDRLDPWVGPPVVLVVGEADAKFVDINTHTLARLVRQRTTTVAGSVSDGNGGAAPETEVRQHPQQSQEVERPRSGMEISEQLEQLGHALVRIGGVGHAVHCESPERVLAVLRETAAALEGPGR